MECDFHCSLKEYIGAMPLHDMILLHVSLLWLHATIAKPLYYYSTTWPRYGAIWLSIYIYASLLWLHATIAKHSTTTPWHDLDTVQHDFQYILKKEKKEEENITYKFWNRLKVEDHPKLKGVSKRVPVGFLKILSFLYKKLGRINWKKKGLQKKGRWIFKLETFMLIQNLHLIGS